MAVNATYHSGLNGNYEMQSGLARGLHFATGTIKATYSAAGGVTWSLPFAQTLFVYVSPTGMGAGASASMIQFRYLYTSTMLQAFEFLATTTAAGHCEVEVPSDTDFTTTTLADHVRFVAFGF